MNKKILLVFTLLILLVMSVSLATAQNHSDDNLSSDAGSDGDVLKMHDDKDFKLKASDDKSKVGDDPVPADEPFPADDVINSVTVKKEWDDNNDASGKRPSSVNASYTIRGDGPNYFEISADSQWQYTIVDLGLEPGDSFTVSEDPVPGYTTEVSGNASTGFVITNKLVSDDNKNDTNNNQTNNNQTSNNQTNSTPSEDTPKSTTTTKVTTTTTTKTVPSEDDKENNTNTTQPKKDTHNTGIPVLLGVLALSGAGLGLYFRRRE